MCECVSMIIYCGLQVALHTNVISAQIQPPSTPELWMLEFIIIAFQFIIFIGRIARLYACMSVCVRV